MKVKLGVALTEKDGERRLKMLRQDHSARDRFVYYIHERLAIRARREDRLPRKKWTYDPILRMYKFTNVRREWDYTSQWLIDHWYTPHGHRPTAGLAAALARFICFVPSLEAIGFPKLAQQTSWERWEDIMLKRQARGEKTFTSAYMIRADKPNVPKITTVLASYLKPVWNSGRRPLATAWRSAVECHEALREYHGWGDFMTQEVVLDLMWTWVGAKMKDRNIYGFAGPGAIRGLNRIHDRPLEHRIDRLAARQEMIDLALSLNASLPSALRNTTTPVHDIEFSLCEFDKYERALWGQGRPKQRYSPRSQQGELFDASRS